MNSRRLVLAAIVLICLAWLGTPQVLAQQQALKDVFADNFLVGAAIGTRQVMGESPEALELAAEQFNSITPENLLKWGNVHPEPDRYDFEAADKFVEFGEKNGMFIVGHTLIWHAQTPRWVYEDEDGNPLDREALLERMRDHIHTVVGRYKGRIHGWDVVNEAIATDRVDDRDGSWRSTKWREIIGPDYIEKAFEFAHEADPNAELYYNDFDEWKVGKRALIAELVRKLRDKGLPIDGIGLQGHWGMDYPTITEVELMFRDLSQLGVPLMITELDLNVLPNPFSNIGADVRRRFELTPESNPYPEGLPEVVEKKVNERYALLFDIFHEYRDHISRVTFWGVNDGHSWLNNWPIRGRTNYPLLFDRQFQPKPVFDAVVRVASEED